jgi:hypothetical protein
MATQSTAEPRSEPLGKRWLSKRQVWEKLAMSEDSLDRLRRADPSFPKVQEARCWRAQDGLGCARNMDGEVTMPKHDKAVPGKKDVVTQVVRLYRIEEEIERQVKDEFKRR